MGIYKDAFFNTLNPFLETIAYTRYNSSQVNNITAIISRKQETEKNFRKMTSNFMIYPIEIIIKKSDIESVEVNKDKLVALNKKGESKTFLVKEVIWSDPETWTIGCLEVG